MRAPGLRRLVVLGAALGAGLVVSASVRPSRAAEVASRWVDRPLVLEPFHARLDVGLATARVPLGDATGSGRGVSLEAVLGLPFLVELGLRTGARFGDAARLAGADAHARLFDHETANAGAGTWANPEIRARMSLFAIESTTIGFELRFVVPRADGTHFTAAPGAPLRIGVGHVARIDTGVFFPLWVAADARYAVDVPIELYFQVGDLFFGPMTGVRYERLTTTTTTTTTTSRLDVSAGLAAGTTLLGRVDLKAQVYTRRVNDAEALRALGLGVALAVTL